MILAETKIRDHVWEEIGENDQNIIYYVTKYVVFIR